MPFTPFRRNHCVVSCQDDARLIEIVLCLQIGRAQAGALVQRNAYMLLYRRKSLGDPTLPALPPDLQADVDAKNKVVRACVRTYRIALRPWSRTRNELWFKFTRCIAVLSTGVRHDEVGLQRARAHG